MRNRLLIIFGVSLFALVVVAGLAGYSYYQKIFAPNVPTELSNSHLLIPTNSSFEQVLDSLTQNDFIEDQNSFVAVAKRMNYEKLVMRSGRFEIQPNWSNYDLIAHLRGGEQATVKVVLTNERLVENVAAKAARFIEPDSIDLLLTLKDEIYLKSIGYTPESLMSLFIPNTYDFYWNTSPQEFVERMKKEHEIFWGKDNRKAKAEQLDMTPNEVYTLASIVEKETLRSEEKRRMAGVYLNRLKKGMLLQADPTAVFARRDFAAKRVTNYHTQFDSPYNTYMYIGLPPGPISMASISSIDAVLNSERHDYYYFCAKGDGTGYHNFAKTLAQHNQNAQIYYRKLRERGLR